MKANTPLTSPMESDLRPEREKLIRLLSALMARRWWREQLREGGRERLPTSKKRDSKTETDNS